MAREFARVSVQTRSAGVREYQYDEFQAVDERLSDDDQAALRAVSSRAKISATCFVNVYNYGDFRGDPHDLMRRYFDGFVYEANWGSHELMLRLPASLLDPAVAGLYTRKEGATLEQTATHPILRYESNIEEPEWVDDSEHWLNALLPLRDELAAADLRPLYLGSLQWVRDYAEDAADREPPVPPGLRTHTRAQEKLVEFLRIDEGLLAAASACSAPLFKRKLSKGALERWVNGLAADEKDAIILRPAQDKQPSLSAELLRRFEQAVAPVPAPVQTLGRTVRELMKAAGLETDAE